MTAPHLSDGELECLLEDGTQAVAPDRLLHLRSCETCQRVVREAREVQLVVVASGLRSSGTVAGRSRWMRFAPVLTALAASVVAYVLLGSGEEGGEGEGGSILAARPTILNPTTDTAGKERQVGNAGEAPGTSPSGLARPNVSDAGRQRVATAMEIQTSARDSDALPVSVQPQRSAAVAVTAAEPSSALSLETRATATGTMGSREARSALIGATSSPSQSLTMYVCADQDSQRRAITVRDSLRRRGVRFRQVTSRDSLAASPATTLVICAR
jgi:hypothetical protein